MEARILREDGSEASINEPGELFLRGGNVALGYRKNRMANEELFIDGWLRTGDRFRVDEEGNFLSVPFDPFHCAVIDYSVYSYNDRTKVRYFSFFDIYNYLVFLQDILKVSGMQVSPVEIEGVLLLQPDKLITDVTVAGVSGGRLAGEKVPRAWIVLSEVGKKRGASEVVKHLDSWCRKNLSRYKWLRGGIEVVAEVGHGITATSFPQYFFPRSSRYPSRRRGRCYAVYYKRGMKKRFENREEGCKKVYYGLQNYIWYIMPILEKLMYDGDDQG
jgi:acyl-CoA synthetase (AMP-forming)/AMP-acid ligase II